MIQEFTIENTFSIKSRQTISFEASNNGADETHYCLDINGKKLLKIAALYGPNASGKSNVIRAFSYYIWFMQNAFSALKPKEDTGFTPFLFDKKTQKMPGTFELIFYMEKVKYEYLLVLDKNCIYKESLLFSPKNQKKLIFERVCLNAGKEWADLEYAYKWGDMFSGSKKKIASMTRPNATFLNTAAQLNHPVIREVFDWLNKMHLPRIVPSNQRLLYYTIGQIENDAAIKNEVLSFLAKADFGHINDIMIKNKEIPVSVIEGLPENAKSGLKNPEGKYITKEIFLSHNYNGNFTLPIREESRGTRRLLELAGPILEIIKNNKFLCIDEIEASLHEELLEFIIKIFLENSSGSQILFTTHNQELLDSGLLRDDEVWFIEKGDDGGSEYHSMAEYTGIRKNVSRMKLYKAGKFGALPIISDYVSEK
jgi:AAA15 family ATPase/GTPase